MENIGAECGSVGVSRTLANFYFLIEQFFVNKY